MRIHGPGSSEPPFRSLLHAGRCPGPAAGSHCLGSNTHAARLRGRATFPGSFTRFKEELGSHPCECGFPKYFHVPRLHAHPPEHGGRGQEACTLSPPPPRGRRPRGCPRGDRCRGAQRRRRLRENGCIRGAERAGGGGGPSASPTHREAQTSLGHTGDPLPGLHTARSWGRASRPNLASHLLFPVFVTSSENQAEPQYLFEEDSGLFASFYR